MIFFLRTTNCVQSWPAQTTQQHQAGYFNNYIVVSQTLDLCKTNEPWKA